MEETQNDVIVNVENNTLLKVFFRMFLGLLATGLTSLYVYNSGLYITILSSGVSYLVIGVVEIIIVLAFSLLFRKLSPLAVTVLFYLYAFINGITLSVIFAYFEMSTIFYAFFSTAMLFGGLAAFGYFTKRDMSKLGSICIVALIVGIVVSLVNLIIGSDMIYIILDWFMIIVFSGLTIYDINKIKIMGEEIGCESEKLYIYGAMELYLDFINIFIRILSIMGRRKN